MSFKHKLSKRLAMLFSVALLLGCTSGDRTIAPTDPSFVVTANLPGTITDLRVTATTDTTATLAFTEVDNGAGLPASYDVRYAVAPLAWGGAIPVARGTCKTPMAGTTIGAARVCIVRGLSPATSYRFQAVAFRDTLNVNAVFGSLSNVASGATQTGTVGKVTNLAVVAAADSSVTLSFTEVGNGAGQPASYDVRFAAGTISWSSATTVTRGSCATPVAGTAIGANRTCTILGLKPATSYQFQLVAFRGTLNVNAVFGARSNIASGSIVSTALTSPGAVANLSVAAASDSSVTLSFTEVTDGAGHVARYDIRYAAGSLAGASASNGSRGTGTTPVVGPPVRPRRTCAVLGLASGTGYQLQLVAFRGTLNIDAVFGPFSNVANGATSSAAPAPVASVTVNPSPASVGVGQTLQLGVVLKDASGNALTGRTVTWSSAAPLLATVSGTGLVTGVLAGIPTITATRQGESGI